MTAPLAVLLLAGPAPDPAAVAATVASVRAEVGPDAPVLALEDAGPVPASAGVPAAAAEQALGAGELLAFARPGDRWRPGSLAVRLPPFAGRPAAALGVAAHVIVAADGGELVAVRPPFPPFDPAELLLRPSIEAAAVLVRAARIDAGALRLLARPHGDAVLWSRLARDHGLVPTDAVVAKVPFDPERHGVCAPRSSAVLLAAAIGPDADRAGGSTIRRELLRRLYLDGGDEPVELDLAALLGDGAAERARDVVRDLQWALERQREALAAERVRWPVGEVAAEDALTGDDLEDAAELRAQVAWLHREVALRDHIVEHLETALRRTQALVSSDPDAPTESRA